MSNLYKQRYIVADNANTRVINSNTIIAAKMEELEKELKKTALAQANSAQSNADGFIAGLQLEVVDAVPKEEEISIEELHQQAEEESDKILTSAREEADAILAEANRQAEAIRKQAEAEGHAEGLEQGRKQAESELAELRGQMQEEQNRLEEDYRQKTEELEPYLVDVIADVFEKVFHVQFDDKKEILIYLIQNTILSTEGTKEFQIRVGMEDYEFLTEHMEEITRRVGKNLNMELMGDSGMKPGQCIIETDSGVFDCGIDVQLDNLVKALRSLSL